MEEFLEYPRGYEITSRWSHGKWHHTICDALPIYPKVSGICRHKAGNFILRSILILELWCWWVEKKASCLTHTIGTLPWECIWTKLLCFLTKVSILDYRSLKVILGKLCWNLEPKDNICLDGFTDLCPKLTQFKSSSISAQPDYGRDLSPCGRRSCRVPENASWEEGEWNKDFKTALISHPDNSWVWEKFSKVLFPLYSLSMLY